MNVASNGRHGVVGVLTQEDQYLVIRRSRWVRAPRMLCFPGGHIERGESFEEAICREMMEELNLDVTVDRQLWTSRTSWGTDLEWMLLRSRHPIQPIPNPSEVEEVLWLPRLDMLARNDLLGSVPAFFEALDAGHFSINQD